MILNICDLQNIACTSSEVVCTESQMMTIFIATWHNLMWREILTDLMSLMGLFPHTYTCTYKQKYVYLHNGKAQYETLWLLNHFKQWTWAYCTYGWVQWKHIDKHPNQNVLISEYFWSDFYLVHLSEDILHISNYIYICIVVYYCLFIIYFWYVHRIWCKYCSEIWLDWINVRFW